MITTLLFDYGSTLDGSEHWLDRFHARYRAAGIDISRADLDPAYSAATRAGYQAGAELHEAGLDRLMRFLVGRQIDFLQSAGPAVIRARIGGLDAGERADLCAGIAQPIVAESGAAMARSRAVLERLAARFKLGVVSNFYGNLDRILEEAAMRDLFGAVIDSSRVGFFKPDPRIFTSGLDAMGAASAETAMIGDSIDKDLRPAAALGMRTVWYRPSGSTGENAGEAEFTIRDLGELLSIQW
jgi:putative hydrolase of the HAD superfamily